MQTRLNPYLSFRDNAREAMEFYRSVFGGKLTVSTFKEYHASEDPSEDNKVMHAMLEGDNGIVFMAADTPNAWTTGPARTSVCRSVATTRKSCGRPSRSSRRVAPL